MTMDKPPFVPPPCGLIEMHDPHVIDEVEVRRFDGSVIRVETTTCPGLKVHPFTMIGGAYREEDMPA
jgi:hypothetical protein